MGINSEKLFKATVMSYVVQIPHDLEGALKLVKEAKEKQLRDDNIYE